ncbi:hypothetical protein [Hornefia butyriciproducens]|uniref:hypothetical protein n=1 Tax=Hornefia butyriciproducens TaxID=2652293 RepID=UPI0023EFF73D|nr:hypothetical protein [Hornefia butyriciproducens]MDD6298929.1 hypothetical protein [Hornefia butyriciproducens]
MKRTIIITVTAALLAVLMAVCALAEYVACVNPDEPHDMSEWKVVNTFDDGRTLSERVCSKCGYVQKGYGHVDGVGIATTRSENMAVTTSLITEEVAASNPSTGAAL